MNDFWNNISRYPRFFISSLAGLILVILTPFKNLFKIKKLRIFVIIIDIVYLLEFYTQFLLIWLVYKNYYKFN